MLKKKKATKEARLAERKVCFILDACHWEGVGQAGLLSKGRLPYTDNQGARAFIDLQTEGGLHAETARSARTVILKLVQRWSDSIILIVLSTVNLQFLGRFVPISLRPILGMVAVYVMATVWSSCSYLLPPGGGFSIYKTAHRVWLWILSIALEKELKVLDFAYWLNYCCFVPFAFLCFCIFSLREKD